MILSRRSLLIAAPTVIAAVSCSPFASRSTVNVRDHGAVGDGSRDDSAAIISAVAALAPGSVLHFPVGSYRFAELNPRSGAAVCITGMSDVDVDFEQGAELVMDNVDQQRNTGTSHGFLIRGPASNISMRNVKVRWARRPIRSMGDGIRIVGYAGDGGVPPIGWTGPPTPVSGIQLSDCVIQSAPQAGVVMLGVSDITVSNLRSEHTLADGLHFNACRRAKVSGHSAVDNGDDGLALVTYFSDEPSFDPAAETFAFPELTAWSNADFAVENVTVSGGRANGVRVAGAQRVTVNGLTVSDKQHGAAIMVDSATAGYAVTWDYVSTRGLNLTGLTAEDCETGIHVLARPPATVDARFSDFSVDVEDVRLTRCTNWAVRVESLSSQSVTGVNLGTCVVDSTSAAGGNGGVGLANTKDVHLDRVTVEHAQAVTTFSAVNTARLTVGDLELTITEPDGTAPSAPCARFENTDGVIDNLAVRWPSAPSSWNPVTIAPASACDPTSPALKVQTLTVEPSNLADRTVTC
jgi:hypothetical protein